MLKRNEMKRDYVFDVQIVLELKKNSLASKLPAKETRSGYFLWFSTVVSEIDFCWYKFAYVGIFC